MTIETIIGLMALPAGAWALKMLLDLRTTVTEIKTTLIGMDGQNGLRSDVKNLKERVTLLENPREAA